MDYHALIARVSDNSMETKIAFLTEELPHLWGVEYQQISRREVSVVCVRHNSFEYIYDNYSYLEATGAIPYSLIEDRVVAVLGLSTPQSISRDDYRLRGWVGPTEKTYGRECDKGHFIAHSLGGAVDRLELNVFVQRRDLNRGWSAQGKHYRAMEKHCVLNPGTFCFSRPLYRDQTSRPAFLEFGLLKQTGELWVEVFDNSESTKLE
jgi:hypothetical protein